MTVWQGPYDKPPASAAVILDDMPRKERRAVTITADMIAAGRRLQAAREALPRTQEQLASALGIERGRLAMWETGKNPIEAFTMLRLFRQFQIPLDFIFAGVMRGLPADVEAEIRARLSRVGMPDPTQPPVGSGPMMPTMATMPTSPQTAAEPLQRPLRPTIRRRAPGGGSLHEADKPFGK